MGTRIRRCAAVVVLVGALASPALSGCGGDSGGSPGESGTVAAPAQLSQFAAAYAHAICDNVSSCCQSNGFAFNAVNCFDAGQGVVQAFLVNPAMAAGGTYNPSAASACLTAVAGYARACNDLTSTTPSAASAACRQVVAGTKQPGEACATAFDCASPSQGTAACLQYPSIGPGADGGTQSISGSLCQVTVTGSAGATCSPVFGAGGVPPSVVADCGTSTSAFICASGVCQAREALGATCGSTFDCVSTAYCNGATCTARLPAGSACDPASDSCDPSTYCEQASSTCKARLASGQACTATSSDPCLGQCNGGLCRSSSLAEASVCGG